MSEGRLPDRTRIYNVDLRVTDRARALAFYRDMLGLRVVESDVKKAALSANGQRPALLNLHFEPDASPRRPRTTGLYHVALRLPDRAGLANVVRHLLDQGWPLQGAADHRVSEAIYLTDPDGNGLELYVDRPRDAWVYDNGQIAMTTQPLNVEGLLDEADPDQLGQLAPETVVGHMHLHVGDLKQAELFYHKLLGLDVTQRSYPGALFMAAGGYHHHLGVNIWAGRNAPRPLPDAVGLIAFGVCIPDEAAWQAVIDRMTGAGVTTEELRAEGCIQRVRVWDPDGNAVELVQTCGE